MRYLSVCAGIEAATVAWEPLGWRCVGFSEIDKFARAVLAHHWPDVPLHGDFRALIEAPPVGADVLVGGTPCQAFSLAGLRRSLDDERGNLTLEYVRLANAIDAVRRQHGRAPCVIVWENVPGVLSTSDNAFGCFLAAVVGEDTPLVSLGGGKWPDAGMVVGPERAAAWRILDAQYFKLAQRRRRVFVAASARDGFDPAAILFEPEGCRRHHPPRRGSSEGVAGAITAGAFVGGAGGRVDGAASNHFQVAHTLRAEGFDASEDGTGRGIPLVAQVAATLDASYGRLQGVSGQDANHGHSHLVAFDLRGREGGSQFEGPHDTANLRAASGDSSRSYVAGAAVRRLTPRECERLQGFPDDHTLVPWRGKLAPDGPRYKALGNSMAVPVMRWIGERIAMVEAIAAERAAA